MTHKLFKYYALLQTISPRTKDSLESHATQSSHVLDIYPRIKHQTAQSHHSLLQE